jgi:SAM-dependent methyltransferase
MGIDDTHRLGYRRVDDDANVSVLLSTMDTTAAWEATRRLRSWERDHLNLHGGQRMLDVGCGLGEAALALAGELGDAGELVGVDLSAEMLRVARSRATAAHCRVRFSVGDACSLGEPDGSFDVVRSERTLQWLTDPLAAIGEMVRVTKPGGRVSLIDTDWSTFEIDVGDDDLARRVRAAMRTERARPSNIGGRLHELVDMLGCGPVGRFRATHTWTAWDPDRTPAPEGCFSMRSLADDLVDCDQLTPDDRDEFVSIIEDAARRDQFSMQLTMYAVMAETPTSQHRTYG